MFIVKGMVPSKFSLSRFVKKVITYYSQGLGSSESICVEMIWVVLPLQLPHSIYLMLLTASSAMLPVNTGF